VDRGVEPASRGIAVASRGILPRFRDDEMKSLGVAVMHRCIASVSWNIAMA